MPETTSPPKCVECGREWMDTAERWRSRLTYDGEAVVFCVACDKKEFGGDDA